MCQHGVCVCVCVCLRACVRACMCEYLLPPLPHCRLTGKSPFVGPTQDATIANITALQLDTECVEFVHLSPDCKDFILERVFVKNLR